MVTKEVIHLGMTLLKYAPVAMVDTLVTTMAKILYGDLSKYGLFRPKQGPFATKLFTGKAPVIDVGTVEKIRDGEIQVPSLVHQISSSSLFYFLKDFYWFLTNV